MSPRPATAEELLPLLRTAEWRLRSRGTRAGERYILERLKSGAWSVVATPQRTLAELAGKCTQYEHPHLAGLQYRPHRGNDE